MSTRTRSIFLELYHQQLLQGIPATEAEGSNIDHRNPTRHGREIQTFLGEARITLKNVLAQQEKIHGDFIFDDFPFPATASTL